jgi:hypothetical protein
MDSFRQFLNEMIVHRVSQNPNIVIAFRQHLWLLGDGDNDEVRKILDTIVKENPKTPEYFKDYRVSDLHDFGSRLIDAIPDSFYGSWDAKQKVLWVGTSHDKMAVTTSPLAKKVAQTLGARSIQYSAYDSASSNEFTVKVGRQRLKGDWPDVAFHGTTSEYIESILIKGIAPFQSGSNWAQQGVHHDDKVFFTANLEEAKGHAAMTARKTRGIPVVVAAKIPDKNLILPDYDIDSEAGRSTYDHERDRKEFDSIFSVDSTRASKHAGRFAYKGRVPASHIVYLLVWSSHREQWMKISKFNRLKDGLRNQGNDYWFKYGEPESGSSSGW